MICKKADVAGTVEPQLDIPRQSIRFLQTSHATTQLNTTTQGSTLSLMTEIEKMELSANTFLAFNEFLIEKRIETKLKDSLQSTLFIDTVDDNNLSAMINAYSYVMKNELPRFMGRVKNIWKHDTVFLKQTKQFDRKAAEKERVSQLMETHMKDTEDIVEELSKCPQGCKDFLSSWIFKFQDIDIHDMSTHTDVMLINGNILEWFKQLDTQEDLAELEDSNLVTTLIEKILSFFVERISFVLKDKTYLSRMNEELREKSKVIIMTALGNMSQEERWIFQEARRLGIKDWSDIGIDPTRIDVEHVGDDGRDVVETAQNDAYALYPVENDSVEDESRDDNEVDVLRGQQDDMDNTGETIGDENMDENGDGYDFS
jgi:hypothetical protein